MRGNWDEHLDQAFNIFIWQDVGFLRFVDENHHLRNGGVEVQVFKVFGNFLDGFVVNLVEFAIVEGGDVITHFTVVINEGAVYAIQELARPG